MHTGKPGEVSSRRKFIPTLVFFERAKSAKHNLFLNFRNLK